MEGNMSDQGFNRANRAQFEHVPPGGRVSGTRDRGGMDLEPGDFILTHGAELFSQLIRFGQQLRFHGADNVYTYWNHAALVVSADGTIVEALGTGVARRSIDEYANTQFTVVRIEASSVDRAEAAAFAERCVGLEYGYTTIVSIGLSLLTGGNFNFGFSGQMICSGLVARALERTTAIFAQDPSHVMPAELAKIYEVPPPPAGSPKGRPMKRAPRSGEKTPIQDRPPVRGASSPVRPLARGSEAGTDAAGTGTSVTNASARIRPDQ